LTIAKRDNGGLGALSPPRPTWASRLISIDRALLTELVGSWIFTTWVAWPFLRPDRYVTGFDALAYSGPNLRFTLESWKAGRIPAWNDTIFGGAPHLGNHPSGALYPLKVLALPFDTARGLGLLVVVHLLLAATGMVILVRQRLHCAAPAGLMAAAITVASGPMLVRSIQFEQVLVVSWIPLGLVALDRCLRDRRPQRGIVMLALVIAMTVLAGHPQLVYVSVPAYVVFALCRMVDLGAWRRIGRIAVAGALGAMASAMQLLPSLSAASNGAVTGGRSLASLRNPDFVADPAMLIAGLLGDMNAANPTGLAGSSEAAAYVGAAAMCLALIGLVTAVSGWSDRRATAIGCAILAIGAVVASFGARQPLFRLAYRIVPGFDQARVPGRWMTLVPIAVAMLAAFGLDRLRRNSIGAHAALASAAVGLAFVALIVAGPAPLPRAPQLAMWGLTATVVTMAANASRSVHAATHSASVRPNVLWPAVMRRVAILAPALVVMIELGVPAAHSPARDLLQSTSFTGFRGAAVDYLQHRTGRTLAVTFDSFDQPRYLASTLRPNTNTLFGIRSLDGYDGGLQLTERWVKTMGAVSTAAFNPDLTLRAQIRFPLDSALLARFGVRWVLMDMTNATPAEALPGWKGPVVVEGQVQLWENPAYRGEATVWHGARRVADVSEAAAVLRTAAPVSRVLLESDAPGVCSESCAPPAGVEVTRPHPGKIVVHVEVAAPAVVSVTEQAQPGWSVRVDDKRARLLVADGMLSAVAVPIGAHSIEFVYHAPGLRLGKILTAIAVLIMFALLMYPSVRQRRQSSLPHLSWQV
jgi:hypothetical protein